MKSSTTAIAALLCCTALCGCATPTPPPAPAPAVARSPSPAGARPTDLEVLRAAQAGRATDLRELLRRGGNPHATAPNGLPALFYAMGSKNAEAVATLLQQAPDLANQLYRLDAKSPLHPPLVDAVLSRQPAVVQVLLSAGARLDWTTDSGEGVLQMAAVSGEVDTLKALIGAGADPKQTLAHRVTLMQLAALQERPAMIAALAALGISPNARDDYGTSPLLLAVDGNRLEVARALLTQGAWPYTRDAYGETALSTAKRRIKDPAQQKAMVDLLSAAGAPANGKNRPLDDAYLDAVRRGDLAAVKKALADGADIDARTTPAPYMPVNAAPTLAVAHPQVLAYLIDHGVNFHACSSYDFTPLHTAASRGGSIESVELLVQHGVDINLKSKTGATPLSMAIRDNQPSMVKALLRLGADAKVRDIGGGNLLAAAREEHKSKLIAPMLVAAGATEDPAGMPEPCQIKGNETPVCSLPLFINNGNSIRVEKALEGGISINTPGPGGRSYLMIALQLPKPREDLPPTVLQLSESQLQRRLQLAHYLIDHGINVKATDEKGFTALHFAATDARLVEFIEPLVAKGADPDARGGVPESTPLMIAVQDGHAATVEALLRAGARPDVSGERGLTPLKLAVSAGRADLIGALLRAGAQPDFDAGTPPSPRQMSRGKSADIQALFPPAAPAR